MQIKLEQLSQHLKQNISPVYFIFGDEPLLVQEASDTIRSETKAAGYEDREIFNAEKSFDWNTIMHSANEMSLFAQKRILDLRIPSGKPGKVGAEIIKEYCERIPEDTILLVTSGKLESSSKNSAWFKALDKVGVTIQIWPVDQARLPMWVDQRIKSLGMSTDRESVRLLADRVEGNLLAASQEVEKLRLLYGERHISAEEINTAVADSARFDVFGLVDAALTGNVRRVTRMINGLKVEGVEAILVLWALSREIRILANIATEIKNGQSLNSAIAKARVWNNRKQIVSEALRKRGTDTWQTLLRMCLEIDKSIKGLGEGEKWQLLSELVVKMCGVKI